MRHREKERKLPAAPGGGEDETPPPVATAVAESPNPNASEPKTKRQQKKKKATKPSGEEATNSKRVKKVKRRTRRRTERPHAKRSDDDGSAKPLPSTKKPSNAAAAAATSPKIHAEVTQDEGPPSGRPVVAAKPKKDREKISLNKLMSPTALKKHDSGDVKVGSEIDTETKKYKLMKKLGAGGCGETFVVKIIGEYRFGKLVEVKSGKELCVKVELLNKEDRRLAREFEIYRQIDKQKKREKGSLPHLLRCSDFGEEEGVAQFMFLPLCQNSLEGYMKQGSPTLATAFEMSIQVLEGIQELHSIGYIHRDFKPANIVINAELTKAYIIDLGMSCKFITDPAKMPESSVYDFIGTTKYAPRDAHKGLPQSRKSDIEAWLYVILELFVPDILPWRDCTKNKDVLVMKELFFNQCYDRRIAQAPSCYAKIFPLIEATTVVAEPDYKKIFDLIQKDAELRKLELKKKLKFDSTLLKLEIELWKTGKEQSQSLDMNTKGGASASIDDVKMDSEKCSLAKQPSIKLDVPPATSSKSPSKSEKTRQSKNSEEQVTLHSSMKCRIVVPSKNNNNNNNGESDDDSDPEAAAKGKI